MKLSIKELNELIACNIENKFTVLYYFAGIVITQTADRIYAQNNLLPYLCSGFRIKKLDSFRYVLTNKPSKNDLQDHLDRIDKLTNNIFIY